MKPRHRIITDKEIKEEGWAEKKPKEDIKQSENFITPVILHHPRNHKARITYDIKWKVWRIWIE